MSRNNYLNIFLVCPIRIPFLLFLYVYIVASIAYMMTYENAENDKRKNCRKWNMSCYSKMPKLENSFSQKCRKCYFSDFHS